MEPPEPIPDPASITSLEEARRLLARTSERLQALSAENEKLTRQSALWERLSRAAQEESDRLLESLKQRDEELQRTRKMQRPP